ncbi:UBIQUILIN [Salix purpurea]|nr:UBIQUILIN [Salix purpurea]
MAGNAGGDSANPFAALLGTQTGNQARDGSTNPSTTSSETTTGSPAPNTNPLPNPWSTGAAQTNTTRLNPTSDTRPQAPTGLGGLGLPDLDSMFSAMPDAAMVTQLMQNPAISQMMQSFMSSPQYMNQILGMNPQLRSMLDSNPQLREMMQNPEFLRQLTSPETMQAWKQVDIEYYMLLHAVHGHLHFVVQLLTFQQSLMSQLGQRQSTQEQGQTGAGTGTANNAGLEMLTNMFGGLGAGSLAVPNRSNVPPEELYATQLSQLQEMGFFDTQENIRALIATAGNVHAAVERLLGNTGQ